MIVSIDKKTGDLDISLPVGYEHYGQSLKKALYEEFAFEPLSKMVISQMNQFVENWFKEKGVDIKATGEEEA
jgi:hypothetical protein